MTGEKAGDPMFDLAAFSAAVRDCSAALGMSVREAARDSGISPATFNRIQRGKAPDVENYLRIMAWLKLNQWPAPMTAPAAMPSVEIRRIVDDALNSAIPEPWEVSAHATARIESLFASILAEKQKPTVALNHWKARALAAEAALAAERANAVDGSIDIRLDDKGGIDEIFGNGVLCHIERMDKGHWFVNMIRPDQSSEAFWLNGKGKVEFTLHEHRKAPTTGPNVEPWTIAAAIRAQGE